MRAHYKIIHTSCHGKWGSLEQRIFNESVWMEKNEHKIIIIAPKTSPLFLKAKEHKFKVYAIDFKYFSMIKNYRLLKDIFYNEKPDVVNTHGHKDSRLALYAAMQNSVPLRILSRHISSHVRNSWSNRMIYKKLCHYIFTTADYTTRHLQKVFKLKGMQIFSMPNGINIPDHLLDKELARIALATELNLDPGTRFIGFAGSISREKGVSTILKAFRIIKPKLSKYHIAITGKGEDKYIKFLKNLAQDLQIETHVHFTGVKEDIWPYYRGFDCNILPSKDKNGIPFEGIPQALLEAMYCSCPVIGSKSGGIIEIINHKKTGLLFNTQDPSDLADKIMETLQDNNATNKRVKAAYELVKRHHTIDVMGRDIIRIYRLHQVLKEKNYNAFQDSLML